LFRSSRPDYIETNSIWTWKRACTVHCSGLPDRTTLRQTGPPWQHHRPVWIVPVFQTGLHWDYQNDEIHSERPEDCSGLPDRTTLRLRCFSLPSL